MEHYVTLFDSKYIPQGLALYRSMEKWCGEFTLWILAMDSDTEKILSILDLKNSRVIPLAEVETEELLKVKGDRTPGEYCWTLTPFTPSAVFDRDSTVNRVTYVDADLWFRANPQRIFAEFEKSGAAVLLTEHGYAPEADASGSSGIFCVQFMTFVRGASREIQEIWQSLCVEWCYQRFEDGKFGDQKYLDSWPDQFGELVHVLSKNEWCQAPWNATRFPYSSAIFFHFSGLRMVSPKSALLGDYVLNRPLIHYVYRPYLKSLQDAIVLLNSLGAGVEPAWIREESESRRRARYRYWRRRLRIFAADPYLLL